MRELRSVVDARDDETDVPDDETDVPDSSLVGAADCAA
jgi:hypothetical protein